MVFNRDSSSVDIVVEPFSWKQFFAGFWINPKENPDFAWAFAARFFFILGYFVISPSSCTSSPTTSACSLTGGRRSAPACSALPALATTLISIVLAGWWSDKIGSRKIFIYAATVIMVIGLAIPAR